MSDLVGNPEDRFFHNEAQIGHVIKWGLGIMNESGCIRCSGAGCLKLTTSLVKVSFKFQM